MSEIELTPEKIALYRSTALRRREKEQEVIAIRIEAAWTAARKAAKLLMERFGATRVVVFGSLVNGEGSFTRWSDVDVAAWGIKPDQTLSAIGAVMDLGDEVPVNLVDVNTCRPSLLAVIDRVGVEI